MADWEKFKETLLSEKKKVFFNDLNMENTTDADYTHANRVFKGFKIKDLGKNHGLYVQSNTLLWVGVFENFGNMFFEMYKPDTALGLAWQAALMIWYYRYDILIMTCY